MLAAQNLIRTAKGAGGGSYVTLPSVDGVSDFVHSSISLLADADDVTLEELLEARELLEVPAARLAASGATEEELERLRDVDPGRAAAPRHAGAVRLQPGLPPRRDRGLPERAARDRGAAGLRRAPEEPRAVEARREVPPGDQRAPPRDRGGDRGRRRRRGRRRDARASRVPAPVLRAGLAQRRGERGRLRHPGQRPAGRRRARIPAVFRERRARGRGARLRLDLGRRPHLVPEPDPRHRRRALHVRGGHGADHDRRRDRPAAAAPPERGREGVRVARLRLRRPGDPRRRGRRRGREGLRGGRRRRARARRADGRGDARAEGALRAAAGELRRPVLLLRRDPHRAAAGAGGRPAALGRRPLGGGDPAGGDARRRLDPDLGLGRELPRRARRSCPGTSCPRSPCRHTSARSGRCTSTCGAATRATSPSTSSTATASPGRPRSAPRAFASTSTRAPGTSSSTSLEAEDAERLVEVARAAAG